ncbi:hypothetical protein Efla_001630 [Eimeria flavescens]
MEAGAPLKRRRLSGRRAEGAPGDPPESAEGAAVAAHEGGKKKRNSENGGAATGPASEEAGSWIPEAAFEASLARIPRVIPFEGKPRSGTLSVALPASLIANAQSLEMKAALAGQVARTLVVMGVDEIVVYEDDSALVDPATGRHVCIHANMHACMRAAKELQLALSGGRGPVGNLKFAGLQAPLDAPHHLRRGEWLPYREGVVVQGQPAAGGGCLVECGLAHPVECLQRLSPGTRVTLKLHPGMQEAGDGSRLSAAERRAVFKGEAVSPQEPPTRAGLYWGYQVRAVSSLSQVFSGHSLGGHPGGPSGAPNVGLYDCLLGTSERGLPLTEEAACMQQGSHLLVVFGGLQGLEGVLRDRQSGLSAAAARRALRLCMQQPAAAAAEGAESPEARELRRARKALEKQAGPGGPLEALWRGETDELPPKCLFDAFVNTCVGQASRTIRAEEALLITLAALRQAGIHCRLQGPIAHTPHLLSGRKKRRPHLPPLLRVLRAVPSNGKLR